jgi:hypothetical protein
VRRAGGYCARSARALPAQRAAVGMRERIALRLVRVIWMVGEDVVEPVQPGAQTMCGRLEHTFESVDRSSDGTAAARYVPYAGLSWPETSVRRVLRAGVVRAEEALRAFLGDDCAMDAVISHDSQAREPSDDQISSFVRTRSMTALVNSVVPAPPPRSGVFTPEPTASSAAS